MNTIGTIIAIAALLIGLSAGYFFGYDHGWERAISGSAGNGGGNAVACTLEAKMCPDGSYVGRTGPDCTFTPCPGE